LGNKQSGRLVWKRSFRRGRRATAQTPSRRFQFEKRRQYFIGAYYKTFPVAAMRVSNSDNDRLKAKENPTEVLNLHRLALPFANSDQFQTLFSNNF
jgi:hypothetical protein